MNRKVILVAIIVLFIILVGMIAYLNYSNNHIIEPGFSEIGRVYNYDYAEQSNEVNDNVITEVDE